MIINKNITSVILVDCNEIDNFINQKILGYHGVTNIVTFTNGNKALSYLSETSKIYQLILVDIYLPIMDCFEFIDKFNELGLDKTQGNICILTASFNPAYREKSAAKKIKYIEKPLTIEKLFAEHMIEQ